MYIHTNWTCSGLQSLFGTVAVHFEHSRSIEGKERPLRLSLNYDIQIKGHHLCFEDSSRSGLRSQFCIKHFGSIWSAETNRSCLEMDFTNTHWTIQYIWKSELFRSLRLFCTYASGFVTNLVVSWSARIDPFDFIMVHFIRHAVHNYVSKTHSLFGVLFAAPQLHCAEPPLWSANLAHWAYYTSSPLQWLLSLLLTYVAK